MRASTNSATQNPVGAMFGRIAGVYDFLNHFLSLGIDRRWRRELALLAQPGKSGIIADLACGTFDVSLAVHKIHPASIIPAMDFCVPMLAAGLKKLDTEEKRRKILPCAADALQLPLAENGAGSVTMAFGIRNIRERLAAFQEMFRILEPGGKVCILEFGSGQEKIWGGIYNLYLDRILPVIGALVARDSSAYGYLARTIREFPSATRLAAEMEQAGLVQVGFRKLTSGIVCLHWGYKPGHP